MVELTGERVSLRPMRPSDAQALHELWSDADTMRFWDLPPTADLLETAARIGRTTMFSADFAAAFTIESPSGVVGQVAYHQRQTWNRRCEVGWMLHPTQRGRGLANDAVRLLPGHRFGALNCHRVEAMIEPDNAPSRRLAERLGFVLEGGPLRARTQVAGSFRDQLVFGLLAPEFTAPGPRA